MFKSCGFRLKLWWGRSQVMWIQAESTCAAFSMNENSARRQCVGMFSERRVGVKPLRDNSQIMWIQFEVRNVQFPQTGESVRSQFSVILTQNGFSLKS